MRRKGLLTLFITVFSVVAFAGMAFAAQNIFLKTTVPDIPKSTCYQAGTESLSLDNLTRLTNGDAFRFTLSNYVTICKNINFYLRLHDGVLVADGALPASTGAEPVTSTNPAADALNLGGGAVGNDYGLLVTGNVGSQVVNMQVVARTTAGGVISTAVPFTLTFIGGAPANQLIIKLFDKKFLTPYFWKISAGTAYLANSAFAPPGNFVATDNTLCINTSDALWLGEYVQFTANSLPNFGALPLPGIAVSFSGDFFIAHMFQQERYALSLCTKAVVGHIAIGTTGGLQVADNCPGFDFEVAGTGVPLIPGNGYCTDHNGLNRAVIQALDAPFVADPSYTLRLEIQVDRKDGAGFLSGDRGVYFEAGSVPQAISATTNVLACAAAPLPIGASSRFLANGTTASAGAPATLTCTIAAADRAVILTTAVSTMNIIGGDGFLNIDLPRLKYDLSTIQPGWEVRVRVTLTRLPCVTIGPIDVPVGIFGCNLVPLATQILFPYFTSLTTGQYWNGIAVINTGATAGNVTLTAQERDGSVGTFSTPLAARGMYVNTLEAIPWVGAGLGGVQCYITVTSTDIPLANLDGFGMIAENGTAADSMGYIPRK
jgi:hypothetical protein